MSPLGSQKLALLRERRGRHAGAILYGLVATCKAHGIDSWAYLRDVFERIPTHPNRRRAELLPRAWKAARAAQP